MDIDTFRVLLFFDDFPRGLEIEMRGSGEVMAVESGGNSGKVVECPYYSA